MPPPKVLRGHWPSPPGRSSACDERPTAPTAVPSARRAGGPPGDRRPRAEQRTTIRDDRSLGTDVLRTSECGHAASKRPPSRSPTDPLAALAGDEPWLASLDAFEARHPRRTSVLAAYRRLLDAGEHRWIADAVLAERYRPAPPAEAWLNKADGRRKRIFRYGPADELLFRTANRLLQPAASLAASSSCRSFLPGGGARAAFRAVLADRQIGERAALRLDVRDYFNSIDVEALVADLPAPFTTGPTGALLRSALGDRRVERDGTVVDGGRKGVMAGTPLAPMLATLHLRGLDDEVVATGATYARYSDDILALAAPGDLVAVEALVRRRIAERGLVVNEAKTATSAPGEPWDFLGFRYADGDVGLSPLTVRKLRARTTRLARAILRWRDRTGAAPERAAAAFVRRTNRRLYGSVEQRGDFSWATWFLPMLGAPDDLGPLDAHIQAVARYAATGRRTARTRGIVPYGSLTEAGYLPLEAAWWAWQRGPAAYDALISRRTMPARRSTVS